MFKKILLLTFLISGGLIYSQTVYEVEPGTKENKIIITIVNESNINKAENVKVQLLKTSSELKFKNKEQIIKRIDEAKEAEATFTFNINLTVPANKKDTIEFSINGSGISLTKSFVIKYSAPKTFSLEQNYPNPFNPSTTIRYAIAPPNLPKGEALGTPMRSLHVTLKVYDILGNEVVTLVNEKQSPGNYEVKFNASNYASGTYIYRLSADGGSGDFVSSKKMILLK